jgi:syndecan 4
VYTPLPANVDWHVLCVFEANFRWDGLHVGSGGGTVTYLPPLSINIWGAETIYSQRSAWQVADMIIYDRTLSPLEIVDVEANFKYLYGVASMTSTPSSGECSVCEAGYFSVSRGGLSGCEACPIGKYSLAGALTCTNCKVGYSTQQTATGFKHPCRCCAGGYYGTSQIGINGCTICPQGEYQTEGNYTNRCIKCPAGYTTPGMGTPGSDASACSICAGGFESTYVEGTLQCNACPSGTFSKAGQACAGCGKGRYIVIAAPRFNTALESKCHNCVAGKFSGATDATECTACRVGKYMDRIASQVQCEICPAGTIAAATGSTSCTFCPPGKYSTFGSAACVECTAGFYSGKGATVCQSCVAGTYSANAASMCTVCAAGRYSHAYASECLICNAGTYAPMHASRCESCASGTFSAEGAEICSPCPSGTVVAAGGGACETLVVR